MCESTASPEGTIKFEVRERCRFFGFRVLFLSPLWGSSISHCHLSVESKSPRSRKNREKSGAPGAFSLPVFFSLA
jgi:hypothetical protein